MVSVNDYLSSHLILFASPPFGGVGGGFLPPPSGRVGVGLPTHPAYTVARHNVRDNRVDTYIHRYNRGPSLVLSVHCEDGGEQGGYLSGAPTLSLR